ncbi:MAG TPA: cation:proton antiporter [Mycobacterium sp.]|nr:cation:proton antiporter [Mycobacterium sp.]
MNTTQFAVELLVAAFVGVAAVLSNRIGDWFSIPAPALFLIGAAVASDIWSRLESVPAGAVEQVVTVALVVILFDGGMQMGWRRFRSAAGAILTLGIAGTLLTAAGIAATAHLLFGLDWRIALLLGTALSPTDPAVVFSVLGRRKIGGRSGVLLQGESGANDPVGIALLLALLTANGPHSTLMSAAGTFTLQMLVGAATGFVSGAALLWFMRRVQLPAAGLYSLRVLMCAIAIYAVTTLAHGSGFLAVLVAGIVIGDHNAPYKAEIVRFHSALANLAEIVAFILLGFTIELTGPHGVMEGRAWLIGLVLASALTLLIRPVVTAGLLWRTELTWGERAFIAWTGLKGAVPILLGTSIMAAGVADAHRAYEIIFVVVAFSVIVHGSAVPALARRLGVPLGTVTPRPWTLGVRFEQEPHGLHRFTVAPGSTAADTTVADLLADDIWISVITRHGELVAVNTDTILLAGDEVLALTPPDAATDLPALFAAPDTDPIDQGATTQDRSASAQSRSRPSLNRPGFRAHLLLREGWHDAEQVRREHQGQGGPEGLP